jgi:hypothetical protein
VKSDALPVAYTDTGLDFSDGSHIDADVIVFCTGYKGDLKNSARRILGLGIAENLEEFWQCDQEGETRGAWRDTGRTSAFSVGIISRVCCANQVHRPCALVHWPWLRPQPLLLSFLGYANQGRCGRASHSAVDWNTVNTVHGDSFYAVLFDGPGFLGDVALPL